VKTSGRIFESVLVKKNGYDEGRSSAGRFGSGRQTAGTKNHDQALLLLFAQMRNQINTTEIIEKVGSQRFFEKKKNNATPWKLA